MVKSTISIVQTAAILFDAGSMVHTSVITNLKRTAVIAFTVAKDAEVEALEAGERNGLDDRSRDDGDEQQGESCEQQDGQWSGRSQHLCGIE